MFNTDFWEGIKFDVAPDDEGVAYTLNNCPSATEIKIPSWDEYKEAPIEVYQALYSLARVVLTDMEWCVNGLEPNPLVEEKCILTKAALDTLHEFPVVTNVACALDTKMREANKKLREEMKSLLPPERF